MGLSEVEIKNILPAEFGALVDRWNAEQERLNFRAAFIVSAIYNTIRDPKKKSKPFAPEDFIGKQQQKEAKTPEEMLQTVMALNAALGGS